MFNKKTYFIISIILIVFVFVVLFFNQSKNNASNNINNYKLYNLTKNLDLSLSGRVEAKKRKNFFVADSDKLIDIYIQTNEYVKKNKALYRYTSNEILNEIENLRKKRNNLINQGYYNNKQEIKQIEQEISNLEKDAYTTIYSPFSGYVLVTTSTDNYSEIPLIQLYTKQKIIRSSVSEFDYNKISENMNVTVSTINGVAKFEGIVKDIEKVPVDQKLNNDVNSESNNTTSKYNFSVTVNGNVLYGSNVKLTFKQNDIKIPKEAIIHENKIFVYTNGKVSLHSVKIRKENMIYYTSDRSLLNKSIILNPDINLKDGDEVEIDND